MDTCQYEVERTMYQYARVKRTPIMSLANADANFKQIFVLQNNDGTMNFIFLVKSAAYKLQSDEAVFSTLKSLDRESFT